MKLAYFDCFSGVSGDMILGAMLDAGLSARALREVLQTLKLPGCDIRTRRVKRCGLSATKVDVVNPKGHPAFTTFDAMQSCLTKSALPAPIRETAMHILKRMARAESAVHGQKHAHLHEVGAIDTLIDVVGTVAGLSLLAIDQVISSPIHVGSGSLKTAHGLMPVPAPATALLLRGCPVYATGEIGELTTPTGAAILRTLATSFSPLPLMTVSALGIGAGLAQRERPNILRLWIGTTEEIVGVDEVVQVETQMDDMNPQIYEHVMARLFEAGALDVFLTQVIMKRGRPGVLLTLLTQPADTERMVRMLFSETTTLGVRIQKLARRTLERRVRVTDTPHGPIRVKTAYQAGRPLRQRPEFRDVQHVAQKTGGALRPLWEELTQKG